ncbi:MAG: hypothetical protein V1839_03555 [archaeon]
MYKIFIEQEFERDFNKLDKAEQERIIKAREQLKENPYAGKPLGYEWFREKHLNGKRLYYLVYENLKAVLIVALSDKKTQQLTINMIKLALDKYKDKIEKTLSSTL